jgi:hypothetical protein
VKQTAEQVASMHSASMKNSTYRRPNGSRELTGFAGSQWTW